ncbi:type IV pilin biogenesis protein [Yersinia entomophaga]|uniref:Type IV pilin biogenesis protein n=1 Tax=Yersinia entomophaga TaxID=935293 RepID=A0ABN4PVG8_YERET|nr:protein transport protein HofC [Yersinia entomophaga]ANI30943.1 type IV pilin biogenesis protein [Yersinia entomophaga]
MTLGLFIWQGIDSEGKVIVGESLASEKSVIYQRVIQQGLQPIRIRMIKRLSSRLHQGKHLLNFTRQLATLLQAGLPLINSLQLLAAEAETPIWRCLLRDVSESLSQGQALSEAINAYPSVFPAIYAQLIAIGELTGEIDKCCLQLAEQQEKRQYLQKKVAKTLRYPAFVCLVAFAVSALMLLVVLPEFGRLYQTFDAPLPALTQGLLYLSGILGNYGIYSIVAIIGIVLVYISKIRVSARWKQREQFLLLHLPLIAPLVKGYCLSQIFRTLSVTQKAGLTLANGLEAAATSIDNLHYKSIINHFYQLINQGIPLSDALSHQPLFPPLCQQLVRIGEESGSLDNVLTKLAGWQQQQTEELADKLTQMLEPMLMLFVGAVIGTLVIAMYLPIFQLGGIIS